VFRRFQNPLQQGTDVLPNVMQAPPVVRVRGADAGSQAAARILNEFAGQIRSMIGAARQQQATSGQNHIRVMRDFGPVRVSYDRLFGREIIEVLPRPELLQPQEPPKVERLTDVMLDGYIAVSLQTLETTTAVVGMLVNGERVATLTCEPSFDGVGWLSVNYIAYFGDGDKFQGIDDPRRYDTTAPVTDVLTVLPDRGASQDSIISDSDNSDDEFGNHYISGDYSRFWYAGPLRSELDRLRTETIRLPTSVLNAQSANKIEFVRDSIDPGGSAFPSPGVSITLTAEFYTRDGRLFRPAMKSWRQVVTPPDFIWVNDWRVLYSNSVTDVFSLYQNGGPSDTDAVWVQLNLSPTLPSRSVFCQMVGYVRRDTGEMLRTSG